MINLKIFGNEAFEGEYSFSSDNTLKGIYRDIGGRSKVILIQVGGALGRLLVNDGINFPLEELKDDLIEPSISYYGEVFCPVDFMRFMLRFTMRELNIVNDTLKQIYTLVDDMTNGKTDKFGLNYFQRIINQCGVTKAEELLFENLRFVNNCFEDEILEHVNDKHCRNSICRGLFKAQCINACPAHIHIPGFVALMKQNRVKEAYQLMRHENPLSSVCGSVCARPCEVRCRRGEITSTVGVRALQRFISNFALNDWTEEKVNPYNQKSVGVIGGGPSGLTAAYYLKKTGYDVTIYEANSDAGGMLAFGVPSYRLPLKSISDEVKTIEALGVKILTDIRVGVDIGIDDVSKSHDAVLLATGATKGNLANLAHENLMSGIDFLKSVRLRDLREIGENVLIVGGGDVALDCARTAIRMGADVSVSSLEDFDLMPASYEEKKHSLDEGVKFISGYGIKSISGRKVIFSQCSQVFDDFGNFSVKFSDSILELSDIDAIIMAIGQKPELDYMDESFANDKGFVRCNDGHRVSEKVYACGDMVKPTIVIDAIAQGKKAAAQIDLDLGGNGLYIGELIDIPEQVLDIRTFDYDIREEKEITLTSRKGSFEEVTKVFNVEDAKYEAERCMRCDRNSQTSLLLGR